MRLRKTFSHLWTTIRVGLMDDTRQVTTIGGIVTGKGVLLTGGDGTEVESSFKSRKEFYVTWKRMAPRGADQVCHFLLCPTM